MRDMRYIPDTVTLQLDQERCTGCGRCTVVCPHGVMALNGQKARIVDRNGCMECGACALNCPDTAISVTPGVGCAAYIINSWFKGDQADCCGGESYC